MTSPRRTVAASLCSPPSIVGPGKAEERSKSYVGQLVAGRYRLGSLLVLGGMSAIYRATDLDGNHLAVKILYPELLDGEAAQRFERESKLVLGLSHPHVVATLAAGRDEALGHYLVMPLLVGRYLDSVLETEGAIDPQVAARLVMQGASGVAAAHARGVMHRDIQPANLFLEIDDETQDVTVKICGFGSAKRGSLTADNTAASQLRLTRTSGRLGSAMYMSPERAENAMAVDERTDVWSLAVVLWEALSGKCLWAGQTSVGELIAAICREPIPLLDAIAPWVPRELASVVHHGLQRDPDLRLNSVRAFIEALSPFTGGTDRVQEAQLVALTDAARGALQVKVNISASAVAGMANLARGGRGGTSLPPERAGLPRRVAKPGLGTNSWFLMIALVILVGGLSLTAGYLMHKH